MKPACGGSVGEQQMEFGTLLRLLRISTATEVYIRAAARTRTDVPRARETTAAETGDGHQCLPATRRPPSGRLIWSRASMLISVRLGSALASGLDDSPIAGADQSVICRRELRIVRLWGGSAVPGRLA